ncbi:hypothetical protein F7725_025561 [Dissostichus mawsoni]|uniref:Fibronectin type-III domain-containing protein n=1 Tax=Dissostichus mawsoni TaxID=36200 RepID=A0A7J5XCS7_DISMA|nr:hypothetical protein F7725_025561 [Dissostichus mawsoni]
MENGNRRYTDKLSRRAIPLSAPKNLRVSEEWYNRFRISWDVPPSPTMGYRVVYQPISAPSPALETFVGEDVNTMLIVNLLSGTEYNVKVIASYTTGSSEALSGRAKTCKSKPETYRNLSDALIYSSAFMLSLNNLLPS